MGFNSRVKDQIALDTNCKERQRLGEGMGWQSAGRDAEKRKGEMKKKGERERERERSSLHPFAFTALYRCGYISFAVPILKRMRSSFFALENTVLLAIR